VAALLMDSAAHHIVAHLLARYSRSPRENKIIGMAPSRLRRALNYIEENIDRDIGLEDISKNVEMTAHYFCRAFRKAVGVPPHRYLIGRRIERSKDLLASSDKDVTEIALELGFASPSHFSTSFRRAVGHAPSTYRKAVR
jgi:AraC family transcriptional regulator